jgi:predicted PurR-regulated permease PerM
LCVAAWEAIPRIGDQVNQLIQSLPQAFERLRRYLQGREWGQAVLAHLPTMLGSANIVSSFTSALSKAFDGAAGLVVIAVTGLYLGANPRLYQRGLLKLFPDEHQARARDIFNEVAYTLRWWVLGQLIPMGVLGVATVIGLWLLHIPLAFTLGLFTAFMIFIPYIGSLIALAVTLLVALIQGPMSVLYVFIFFIGVHVAEGYLLTPLVQKRAVYLPPALTILTQVLMGLLLGFIGLALATPLTAAALVLVKMLYLHERPEHHD